MRTWMTYVLVMFSLLLFPLQVFAATKDFPLEKALADYKHLPGLSKYSYSKEYFKLLVLSPVSGYRSWQLRTKIKVFIVSVIYLLKIQT